MSRRGATLVETLVAAALGLGILAGAWLVFGTARRATDQALRYGSVLQAASSITAHLRLDLAAAAIPQGSDGGRRTFEIPDAGDRLGFLRDVRGPDLDAVPPAGPGQDWVQWSTEPGPGGTRTLVRETRERTLRWPAAPVRDLRFRVVTQARETWLVAAMHLAPEATRGGGPGRLLPVKVVQRLRPPQMLPRFPGMSYPEDLLGPLPEAETPAPLPLTPDPIDLGDLP